jgi:hypothetical protein
MIKKKTLLILGAGASAAYGYPSGPELMRQFIAAINDENTAREIEAARGSCDCRMREFRNALPCSGQLSIDAFLQHRPEFADYGKAAIAHILLHCEKQEPLFELDTAKNWYLHLFSKMTDGGVERFCENQLKFVTFNYDTSLENFFYLTLRNSFGMAPQQVQQAMRDIGIIHVHGRLNHVPWENSELREYGNPPLVPGGIGHASRQLHIIHDDIEESGVLPKIRAAVNWAEVIIFLGFGYHPLNMERLRIPFETGKQILGTTYGLTDFEKNNLNRRYRGENFQKWVADPEYDIIGFFRNCWALDS